MGGCLCLKMEVAMRSSSEAAILPRGIGVLPGGCTGAGRSTMAIRRVIERLLAVGYGLTYDAVVRGFGPFEALLDEVAQKKRGAGGTPGPVFRHLDVARDPPPGAETFDALVSMHTLYWHPAPRALLDGCRRALKPGGHAVFLTYSRPARVGRTFREVWKREGCASALRALRWLVPTALFEMLRDFEPRYLTRDEFHAALAGAGFEILESRETFLAGISLLAWVQKRA